MALLPNIREPQFLGTGPLDLLFQDVQARLGSLRVDAANEELAAALAVAPDEVVPTLFATLTQIQRLAAALKAQHEEMLPVLLHDMKTVLRLVNTVVLQVYGCLPPGVHIPLRLRRMKELATKISVPKVEHKMSTLEAVFRGFRSVFARENDDISRLLITGTGYTDFLVVAAYLHSLGRVLAAEYAEVEALSPTFELLLLYSLLMGFAAPGPYKQLVSLRLVHLPSQRTDGIRSLIEYGCRLREDEEVQMDKFDHVASVVLAKPRDMSTQAYFTAVGAQLYDILVCINQPELTAVATHIVERLWTRNAAVARDFVFRQLWEVFVPPAENLEGSLEAQVNNAINVLLLLTQRLSQDLVRAVVLAILLPIWRYLLFCTTTARSTRVVTDMLVLFFTVTSDSSELDRVAQNLLYVDPSGTWEFATGPNGLVEVVRSKPAPPLSHEEYFHQLDAAVKVFVEILTDLDGDMIRGQFIRTLRRWLAPVDPLLEPSPFVAMVDLKVLEAMAGEKTREQLASEPTDMLVLVEEVLRGQESTVEEEEEEPDSDDEEGEEKVLTSPLQVALQLLSAVLAETPLEGVSGATREVLVRLRPLVAATKSLAALLLVLRLDQLVEKQPPPTTANEIERRTLEQAVASLNDPLVPIRAHGLHLLRKLVDARLEVVLAEFVVQLHLAQLKDHEPFVYLNVIKGLELLVEWAPAAVVPLLVAMYTDRDGDADERLRVGEVLLRSVQRADEAFVGALADTITTAALTVVQRVSSTEDDVRLRMLGMSILGACCYASPRGIQQHIPAILDCVVGVLQLETDADRAVVRRAAVVLVHDLVLSQEGLEGVPQEYRRRLGTQLAATAASDGDVLCRDQAETVLAAIRASATSQLAQQLPQDVARWRI